MSMREEGEIQEMIELLNEYELKAKARGFNRLEKSISDAKTVLLWTIGEGDYIDELIKWAKEELKL